MTVSTDELSHLIKEHAKMMNTEKLDSQIWSGNNVLATAMLAMTERLDRVIELLESGETE